MYMQKEKHQTSDLKALEIGFGYLIFVKIESCFMCGHLYKVQQWVLQGIKSFLYQKEIIVLWFQTCLCFLCIPVSAIAVIYAKTS